MRIHQANHLFVEYIPEKLDDGILYVSIPFATVTHKCFCGCGWEVTTPIAPDAWELIYDGRSISLNPSVGSRNLKCKSHYWVRKGAVVWLLPFTDSWALHPPESEEQEVAHRGIIKRILRPFAAIRGWTKRR